ncbi:MAG: AAA family ATPase [Candidatus Acidiferrales bacterium]
MKATKRPTPIDERTEPKNPQNLIAEQTILGALLLHPELFPSLRTQITAVDFKDGPRQRVFLKMLELGLSNCDLVAGALAESDRELAAYASELVDQACSPKHVSVYLRELKIASVERQRVLKAQLICDRGRSGDTEGVLAAIVELNTIRDYQPPGEEVQFMCARKLLSKSVTPREFLLDPVLTTNAMAQIFSWRGTGKTFFALSIARAISAGESFLGWKAPKARRVLFIDGELDEYSLQQRIRLLDAGNDYLDLLCCDAQENCFPHLCEPRAQRVIEERIIETRAEVLILDNLSALAPSTNETEAEQWNILQSWFKEMKRKLGITVIFLHHAGHSGTSRGTTRREDLLDLVIELRKPKDYVATEGLRMELVFGKTRGKLSRYAEPLECSLGEFNGQLLWAFKELRDARAVQVADLRNTGMSVRDIAEQTGVPKSTVARIIKDAKIRK